jgi:hypothetical protein
VNAAVAADAEMARHLSPKVVKNDSSIIVISVVTARVGAQRVAIGRRCGTLVGLDHDLFRQAAGITLRRTDGAAGRFSISGLRRSIRLTGLVCTTLGPGGGRVRYMPVNETLGILAQSFVCVDGSLQDRSADHGSFSYPNRRNNNGHESCTRFHRFSNQPSPAKS